MQGQANHFTRMSKPLRLSVRRLKSVYVLILLGFAPEKLKYPIDRYVNESHRLYRTLEGHLAKRGTGYIVGDRVTVADIAIWPWVAAHSRLLFVLQNGPD